VNSAQLFSVEGKSVLVTGGSRGIGRMIAEGFVSSGARVYIAARKEAECRATAEELAKHGPCEAIIADLGSDQGVRALAEALQEREPALHVLVNNAGANWAAPFDDFPERGWDKVMDTNLKAVFNLTRLLRPTLDAASQMGDPARVINIGSIDALRVPSLEIYAYVAAKAGLHHLTSVLAKKLAPRITVNAVAPGPFQSKMMAETIERFHDQIVASCPVGRIGEPEDMAGVSIFLASRAGAYITGAVIPVDGGISTTL
jgi:NAD(P)-dependent dehydrogenase (short-subunit alcohol dehydrogenase family)